MPSNPALVLHTQTDRLLDRSRQRCIRRVIHRAFALSLLSARFACKPTVINLAPPFPLSPTLLLLAPCPIPATPDLGCLPSLPLPLPPSASFLVTAALLLLLHDFTIVPCFPSRRLIFLSHFHSLLSFPPPFPFHCPLPHPTV